MDGPWIRVTTEAVGGLTDVGFSDDGRYLLCVGHQGRSVFDCISGERVARDRRDDRSFLDDEGCVAGVGPLDGRSIRVTGLFGSGRLPRQSGAWTVEVSPSGVDLRSSETRQHIAETEEIRVVGFDPTGGALVVATSSGLLLLRLRDDRP